MMMFSFSLSRPSSLLLECSSDDAGPIRPVAWIFGRWNAPGERPSRTRSGVLDSNQCFLTSRRVGPVPASPLY